MFGMSGGKIIILVAIVVLIWFAVRWINRFGSLRDGASPPNGGGRRRGSAPESPPAVDLERNPVTGAYEPKKTDRS